jgi:RNA-directed DNA polymerase
MNGETSRRKSKRLSTSYKRESTKRRLIKTWLKGRVIAKGVLQESDAGRLQGGVISPLLANIALHGMENEIINPV